MPKKKKRNPTYLVDIKETELKKKKNKKSTKISVLPFTCVIHVLNETSFERTQESGKKKKKENKEDHGIRSVQVVATSTKKTRKKKKCCGFEAKLQQ